MQADFTGVRERREALGPSGGQDRSGWPRLKTACLSGPQRVPSWFPSARCLMTLPVLPVLPLCPQHSQCSCLAWSCWFVTFPVVPELQVANRISRGEQYSVATVSFSIVVGSSGQDVRLCRFFKLNAQNVSRTEDSLRPLQATAECSLICARPPALQLWDVVTCSEHVPPILFSFC